MSNMEEEKKEIVKEEKKESFFQKAKRIISKFPFIPFVVLGIILVVAILIPKRLPDIFEKGSMSKIERICDLATVEAYYHNVAAETKEASTLGKIFGNIGYKKYWLEYDAIIQFGIDAKEVEIKKPNIMNEVKVYVPEAKIVREPILITEYISDPITDTGFLTSISTDDKTSAVGNSLKNLKEKASQDEDLLKLARERAKTFLEQYIITAGKSVGVDYKVIFEN